MQPEHHFLDGQESIRKTLNMLPHWQQGCVLYFLTFRQEDALPQTLQSEQRGYFKRWLAKHPKPWSPEETEEYRFRFSRWEERFMDKGYGSCLLRDPVCREKVENTIMYNHGVTYQHVCWVIMPNHAHTLTLLFPGSTLEGVLQPWKSASAHRINHHLGRRGALWQTSYWDRIIRSWRHFENTVLYIRDNPAKARLRDGEFTLFESDVALQVVDFGRPDSCGDDVAP